MKATTIKQIKFNRGQVSDLLSERVDMGLQNACGTVYDNMYINRYGQLQNAPSIKLSSWDKVSYNNLPAHLVGMFNCADSNIVLPIAIQAGISDTILLVYGFLMKDGGAYYTQNLSSPIRNFTLSTSLTDEDIQNIKFYQFGYNVLLYGQNIKPILLNILPDQLTPPYTDWTNPTVTVKDTYFDNSFDNIFVRGLNIETPTGFTVPTSGWYKIQGVVITTKAEITLKRNGAGGNFTTDLVGQVLLCRSNGGSLQVVKFVDADTLQCKVLSPLTALDAAATDIDIPFNGSTEWLFGYVRAYGDTASPTGGVSYPDSAIFTNQRLIFGGNDYYGSLISASRIGVVNDFDPESATESDAFTTAIASKDFCRIVDFIVSNSELRIACTNGEYAMSLANLTPSGSLNGFDLRSEVGIRRNTAICDCGGLTAYVSKDKSAIYGTQFSLLRDRYQPISLTSQTEDVITDCIQLVYLKNRKNSEGNCLVGLNSDGSLIICELDINSGLVSATKIQPFILSYASPNSSYRIRKLFAVEDCLWGVLGNLDGSGLISDETVVRFTFGEIFNLTSWVNNQGDLIIPKVAGNQFDFVTRNYCALYYNETTQEYEFIKPVSYTQRVDGHWLANFADDIIMNNIVCAGYPRQSDWRSVEIGVGMATRELNKRIVKLEGVIEPTQITGYGRFAGLVLTPEEAKNFITLTRSKDVEEMDVDNLSNSSYTETQDLVWRRAFDNPSREMYFGVSMVAPFLVKSITATIEYDEVS